MKKHKTYMVAYRFISDETDHIQARSKKEAENVFKERTEELRGSRKLGIICRVQINCIREVTND